MVKTPSTIRREEWKLILSHVIKSNALIVTDASGIIVWVNKALSKITGYLPEETIGKTPRIFKSGKHDDAFYIKM